MVSWEKKFDVPSLARKEQRNARVNEWARNISGEVLGDGAHLSGAVRD